MQRILSRGEIEGLDHTLIPRVRLPELASVFSQRARRLRQLADEGLLRGYLVLMANVCEAQQAALARFHAPGPDDARVSLAQAHGMPPIQALGWQRDPVWRDMLALILQETAAADGVPALAAEVCQRLQRQLEQQPEAIETLADALLARMNTVEAATAPFVMAGLQAYWTQLAGNFQLNDLPVVSPFGVCPLCGSLPVAGIVRIGGAGDGCRYMCCSLCAGEWHLVRVTCSHCEDTETIAYHNIEGGSEAVKAESCDHCHSYRKIFYQEKDPHVDGVADDLASLTLDVLMGEAGYSRASGNPLLWHSAEG